MNIVITAGGTSEYIDSVRKITNSGTGKLGSLIANKLSNGNTIFYICSKKAVKPVILPGMDIRTIEISTTMDLKEVVEDILKNYQIDWFIHSMAVSDYIVDYVSTSDMIAKFLDEKGLSAQNIESNTNILNNKEKISSDKENLIICLKKAPKIISIIKKLSPETHLIGFKLLSSVSKDELIRVANNLKKKNNCDYVVANDLEDIRRGNHKALIIGDDIVSVEGKENIANYIENIISKIY